MQVSASTAVASATANAGSGSGAQIARLQKQLLEVYKDLQSVTTDGSLDAKAREVKQKLLQAQIAAIQQQIAALQQAEAQRAQTKATSSSPGPEEKAQEVKRREKEKARDVGKATVARDVSGKLGTQVDTYA